MKELLDSLQKTRESFDRFTHYLNPVNWFKDGWTWLDHTIRSGSLDAYFLAGSIILVLLIMLGAHWPKKYLFWGWVIFWLLRGFVFNA